MRTLLIGALAATLVGCSCILPPQAGMESCADANGFTCFDRTAASQPIEPKPASFQTDSATIEIKSTIAAKTEKPSSAHVGDRAHPAMKTAKPTIIAAKVEPSASVLRGNAEKTAAASPNNTDHLVALLIARPEIKSVSDLTSKIVAIDDRHSASNDRVRTAIAAAGATEVQLSDGQTKAINRLISGEVPAAVLALVSAEAAEGFPEIAGFKIFRIPLSPRSLKARRDTP